MEVKTAEFLKSSAHPKECPPADRPEYAFIGRSNVGKSSLINMVLNWRIAKTSSIPGKTATINYFLVNNNRSSTRLLSNEVDFSEALFVCFYLSDFSELQSYSILDTQCTVVKELAQSIDL